MMLCHVYNVENISWAECETVSRPKLKRTKQIMMCKSTFSQLTDNKIFANFHAHSFMLMFA